MDLPPGTVLGDSYRITRLIGIGGMGAIYEAAHVTAGKRVAIKMMSKELAAHPEALARFRREVKVTTELAGRRRRVAGGGAGGGGAGGRWAGGPRPHRTSGEDRHASWSTLLLFLF